MIIYNLIKQLTKYDQNTRKFVQAYMQQRTIVFNVIKVNLHETLVYKFAHKLNSVTK